MVKHTQRILQQQHTNCFSVFDHFVGLAVKGFKTPQNSQENSCAGVFFLMQFKLEAFLISKENFFTKDFGVTASVM